MTDQDYADLFVKRLESWNSKAIGKPSPKEITRKITPAAVERKKTQTEQNQRLAGIDRRGVYEDMIKNRVLNKQRGQARAAGIATMGVPRAEAGQQRQEHHRMRRGGGMSLRAIHELDKYFRQSPRPSAYHHGDPELRARSKDPRLQERMIRTQDVNPPRKRYW